MPRDAQYVAVYDVGEDRERDRVAKVLEGFGLRVQYSAFELRLTPATRQTLLRRVEDLKLKSGFLYLYRRAGGRDRAAAGKAPEDPLAEDRHAFVLAEDASPSRQLQPRRPKANGSVRKQRATPARSGSAAGAAFNPVCPAEFQASPHSSVADSPPAAGSATTEGS